MESAQKIVLKASQFLPSYRYVLKHIRCLPEAERSILRREMRAHFDTLSTSLEPILASATIKQIWSRVSVMRMNLSRRDRPAIPAELQDLADSLGAAEGGGTFYLTKDGDLITGEQEMLKKAKKYNMDLHEADIRRHYALNERYHFNGPERHRG